jgi:prepilin peptidase CpaA
MEMEAVAVIRPIVLFTTIIVCAYTDIARGKIYNSCTFTAIILGLGINYILGGVIETGWPGANLAGSLAGMAAVGLLFLWPYLKGGIAAGDIKLMLAVAAIGGMKEYFTFYALLYSSMTGALMAIALLIWKGKLLTGLKSTLKHTFSIKQAKLPDKNGEAATSTLTIPYGCAIAIGTVISWYVEIM